MNKLSAIEHCTSIMQEKSERVKSISFHPWKKVIITGLHSGKIQGWNYLYKTKVFEKEEHEGPVRVVVFHHLIERFASGGDDCLIRIWNYKTQSVETIFKGHTDYIRSLEFHRHLPWLLSTSDDQTICIWNFQSKKKLAALTGHTHYVMGARFINDTLFASVSLDQTIRLWDYSALKTKSQSTVMDMLGVPEVLLKHIIDGHDRGINWISVQPGTNTFATGGDDSSIRIWDATTDNIFETDTFHGHHNHVSSLYFTKKDLLISNSEDGSMKIWDIKKRKALKTISIDNRFWCVSMDPEEKLIAAGHDTGFSLYSLEKEEPLYYVDDKDIYIQREREIIKTDTKKESRMLQVKGGLVSFMVENGVLVLNYGNCYTFKNHDVSQGAGQALLYKGSLYVATETEVTIRDVSGFEKETLSIVVDALFSSSVGVLALKDNKLFKLLRPKDERVSLPEPCKRICSGDGFIAVVTERHIIMLDQDLNQKSVIEEIVRINGVFPYKDTLFYSTPMHIKYAFISGEYGALLSTEEPLWLLTVENDLFTSLTKDGSLTEIEVDCIEWRFRRALEMKNSVEVKECIENSALIGQSPLASLIRKGFYREALEHVEDPRIRAELSMKIGEYEDAFIHAQKVNSPELFKELGMCSLSKNQDIAEKAFKEAKDYTSLLLLYISTKKIDRIDSIFFDCPDRMFVALSSIVTQNNEKLCELISFNHGTPQPILATSFDVGNEEKNVIPKDFAKEVANDTTDEGTTTKAIAPDTISMYTSDSHSTNDSSSKKPASGLSKEEISDNNELLIEQALTQRISTLNPERFRISMEAIPENFTADEGIDVGLQYMEEKNYSMAVPMFLMGIHTVIDLIKRERFSEDFDPIIKECSMYAQGMFAERLRSKNISDEVSVSCSIFFASLPLQKKYKEDVLKIAVDTCYEKGNMHRAIEISKQLVEVYKCKDAKIISLSKTTEKMSDKYNINTSLPFCIDKGKYMEKAKKCSICEAYSSYDCNICSCCLVANLQ
ncbi:coatomer subunit alpha [Nematocida sp. LUAm3]|nr:coatomer subunit alpha [Nematocida sp. LUAm3]KAI5175133.1 coatomer subunit alpha [Nematocida sp. LUAm2]KAI5178195.1 coatomer subunit alpha [Nematocida sp. LUAm1]